MQSDFDGMLLAYLGGEDSAYHLSEWPPESQDAYWCEMPLFNLALAETRHVNGMLREQSSTWPGAQSGFVGRGARPGEITVRQVSDDPYARCSPLGRFVFSTDDQWLLLGRPLTALTLQHHAESLPDLPCDRRDSYERPVRRRDEVKGETFTSLDIGAGKSDGGVPFATLVGGASAEFFFRKVVTESGIVQWGRPGTVKSSLISNREVLDSAVNGLTAHFQSRAQKLPKTATAGCLP